MFKYDYTLNWTAESSVPINHNFRCNKICDILRFLKIKTQDIPSSEKKKLINKREDGLTNRAKTYLVYKEGCSCGDSQPRQLHR